MPTEPGAPRGDESIAGVPEPTHELKIGGVVGRYVVLGRLGSGGMGTVLKAYDEALDRAIAVKLLHAGVAERHAGRLTREAQALAKLSHPNVVHVYEVAQTEDQWFIAMEMVHGQTVRQWQEARPSWRDCVDVYLQAGEGLAAAHAQGLVHRDFKPDNCIVDEQGNVKVLDFGLVREVNAPSTRPVDEVPLTDEDVVGPRSLTRTGAVLGTLAYMPLEQLEGKPVDARSDQFGFCVSLYEAVYGERPFAGDSAPRLLVALYEHQIEPAPRGTRVPARLRRALLRGLSRDPSERWPSMEPLLAELSDLVTPRRRVGPALWVGGGLLAVAAGLWQLGRTEAPCHGAREQLSGVWDDGRRHEVRTALLATDLPHAADTWQGVEGRLDDYADVWVERHREVCEATSVRQEQSAEVMDLRMACLSTRRLELRETVRVLADANETTVTRAVGMVAGLRGLSACDDVEVLQAQLPPPDDAEVAAEVEAQRESVLRTYSLRNAGEYEVAFAEAQRVVEHAETLGHAPLLAEAWLLRGLVHEGRGEYAEAERDLQQAYLLAAEHGHQEVEVKAVSMLTAVVGQRQARHDRGLQWGMTALALARGLRADPMLEANALVDIGAVLDDKGERTEALERYREGLAIEQEVLGARHPAVATLLNNMGAVLFATGQHDESLDHHRRAREIWEDSLGDRHPYVGSSYNNIGEVLHRQGELEDALSHYQRAQTIWEASLGPRHPHVAAALTNVGRVWSERGDLEKARAHHARALTIRREALGAEHPAVAESQGYLAQLQELQELQELQQRRDDAAEPDGGVPPSSDEPMP